MDYLNSLLHATFDVKLYGQLKACIGWEIPHCHAGIAISQHRFIDELLAKQGLQFKNRTPLPLQADLTSAQPYDTPFNKSAHARYR